MKEDVGQSLALAEFPFCAHQSAQSAGTEPTEMALEAPELHKQLK